MAKNTGRKPKAVPEPEAAPATPFPAAPDILHRIRNHRPHQRELLPLRLADVPPAAGVR